MSAICPPSTLWVPGAPTLPEPVGCCFVPPPGACATLLGEAPATSVLTCNSAVPPSTTDRAPAFPGLPWDGAEAFVLTLDKGLTQQGTARDDGPNFAGYGWPYGTLVGRVEHWGTRLLSVLPAACAPWRAEIDITLDATLQLVGKNALFPDAAFVNLLQLYAYQANPANLGAGVITVTGASFDSAPTTASGFTWRAASSGTLSVGVWLPVAQMDLLLPGHNFRIRIQYSGPADSTITNLVSLNAVLQNKCDTPARIYNYDDALLTINEFSGTVRLLPLTP